jgi:hypothetical protein
MKYTVEKRDKYGGDLKHIHEFHNIREFLNFVNNNPLNKFFTNSTLFSEKVEEDGYVWSGTKTLDEAKDLLEHGWMPDSSKLQQQLKLSNTIQQQGQKRVSTYDVAGYQACVPRYLQGLPTAMVNSKIVPVKQKVVTITKDISYNAGWSPSNIIDEAIKALKIVQSLESNGLRVKLNVYLGTETSGEQAFCKICIKQPDERVNFSKMAFPLGHPAMLRRFLFLFIERHPGLTKDFTIGYGRPVLLDKSRANEGEYILPLRIENVEKFVSELVK